MLGRPVHRFIAAYGIILMLSLTANFLYLSGSTSFPSILSRTVSYVTLTHHVVSTDQNPSPGLFILILLIIQATGLFYNTMMLWLCRQIFGTDLDKRYTIQDAFKLTLQITLIIQAGLFCFFLYSVPDTAVGYESRFIVRMAMAVGSFHLAGIPFANGLFTPGFMEANFVVQIGLTGAITAGNLGVFVIHELFSIKRLRERMADPTIDWSFITKLSVFAGAGSIILMSALFWNQQQDGLLLGKNITESAIATVYEVSSSRGFGTSLFEYNAENVRLQMIGSLLFGGPFSPAGGITLFAVLSFAGFLGVKRTEDSVMKSRTILRVNSIMILSLIIAVFLIPINVENPAAAILFAITGHSIGIAENSFWGEHILFSFLMIIGQWIFPASCFWILSRKN